ncbi:hypothetical protein OU994_29755 [Pseudoduganella sp. SL102]|uniref:hypothetical protein n=1 Tax=Pseudoduganella sp. SL102 TaxID=2995154 RepID=UPI00248BC46D|nr:hypothetical protein [Pseudoduganella sp. SL102]WBS02379.1 hypothetical protein OU994_29755 [Pseudoduganella sp. SL102]
MQTLHQKLDVVDSARRAGYYLFSPAQLAQQGYAMRDPRDVGNKVYTVIGDLMLKYAGEHHPHMVMCGQCAEEKSKDIVATGPWATAECEICDYHSEA